MSDGLLKAGLVCAALAIAGCAQTPSGRAPDKGADQAVTLRLANVGAETLRCSIVFGHWVYRELGLFAPGQARDVAMMQAAKDGALYVNRYDNQRQMMIENLLCGRPDNWHDSVEQVDLAAVRSTRVTRFSAQCAAPDGPGRVACKISGLVQ
jgi:hypothetical protein